MLDDVKESAPTPNLRTLTPKSFGVPDVLALQRAMLAATLEAQSRAMRRAAALGGETAAFIDRRLSADREAMTELAACRSPNEAMAVCAGAMRRAARDYADAMSSMSVLVASQGQEAIADLRKPAAELSDGVR